MTSTFKDNKGRSWTVVITIAAVRRVRQKLNVDLAPKDMGTLIERVLSDLCLLCDILWVLLEDDAQAINVTDEEFGRSLAGDAIDGAAKAFLSELTNFIPNPRDRARMRETIGRLLDLAEKAGDRTDELIRDALAKLDKEVCGSLSTSSPGSSGSIPDP